MPVSSTVIAAYRRVYTRSQLEQALLQAVQDRSSGVLVTQVNFQEGGGSGQPIGGDPNEVIEIMELCLQEIDGDRATGPQPLSSVVNFSARRSET
jgi:hypothetical protein